MVVTDLHGNWDAYERYRDRFVDLNAQGWADWLIFTGDLIHRERPGPWDQSVDIVLDIIELQKRYGDAVVVLLGNHEMPHIYHISLSRGNRVYTPDFEKALSLSGRRDEIINLFRSLPFYIRTTAGVSIAHAGAPPTTTITNNVLQIFNWSHQKILDIADEQLDQEESIQTAQQSYARLFRATYDALARYYLAVTGPDDPRYNDLLRGFYASNVPEFNDLLWPVLFTRCEDEYGQDNYGIFLDALLKELSVEFVTQQVLVAGHMTIQKGGYQIIQNRHLRVASGRHASPRDEGRFLLFDAAQPVRSIDNLLPGLGSVYKEEPGL